MGNFQSVKKSLIRFKRKTSRPSSEKTKFNTSETTTSEIEHLNRQSDATFYYIDGRRYLDNSSYSLPNDDEEIDRLQLQHYLARYILQSNFCAPVNNKLKSGTRVLDVGCGPGTFTLEMAYDYPNSHFIGIDINPMFPKEIKPRNVEFEEADVLEDLPYADESFDFIVIRNMITSFTVHDWESRIWKELIRVLKPGGYIESTEFEIPAINRGPVTYRMSEGWIALMKAKNIDLTITTRLEEIYKSTILKNIEHKSKMIPVGTWGDRIGKIMADDFIMLAKAMCPVIRPLWGITQEQFNEFTEIFAEELNVYKTYCNIHVVFGQKPDNT
ncbi:3823_t:CDS:2 [Cetraspora pellucida]|uniref:3823_t:CDS:1 n=1 Tax=Cetraspora pellucida TaxID=1433469 RepID=A0A9N8WRT2_9GLOM|nr:3823_t:CDS:2 [Cetraspora pellucida]